MKILNDLYDYGLKIYQPSDGFKFSIDSILLAEFININMSTKQIVDFCCGNGAVPMIISKKTKANIVGIELQKDIANMAKESIIMNDIHNIEIINDSIYNYEKYFKNNSLDIISMNPPYFKYNDTSLINKSKTKSTARHEMNFNIEKAIKISYNLLNNKGHFFLVHRSIRLEELIFLLNSNHFSIKNIQIVYSKHNKNAIMILIDAMKNGKIGLNILPPIFIEEHKSYKNIFWW